MRELHGDARQRDGAPRDPGLGAHALGGGRRPRERLRQLGAERAGLLRDGGRLLHLAEDLRLAHHHRVQAGGHAEQMAQRLLLESADGVRRRDWSQRLQHVLACRPRIGHREDLDAVAGGDQHRLAHPGERLELPQARLDLFRWHGDLLAHRDGRLLVREADAEQRHAPVPCRAGAADSRPT